MADFASKSPVPNEAEGTNNIQIFFAAYVVDGATSEQLADYYSEDLKNRKSKYFDLRNRDPRLFQMGSVLVNLGKSNLIPGLEQGLAGMKVGERCDGAVPS